MKRIKFNDVMFSDKSIAKYKDLIISGYGRIIVYEALFIIGLISTLGVLKLYGLI